MGIAVEPAEPCYDSDCYYSQGEWLTWWQDYGYIPPPQPVIPEPPSIEPPFIGMDYSPGEDPWPYIPPTPPSAPTLPSSPTPPPSGGQTGGGDSSISPLPVPEIGDPLYRAIGSLLSSRPAPAQATPVVIQGRPTNPWPIALVGLAAVGAVAYVMTRRGK
jgi:hypothetical protein